MIHGLWTAAAVTLATAAASVSSPSSTPSASIIATATSSAGAIKADPSADPSESQAGTYFVHGEGDDAAAGSREAPLRTITAALAAAHASGVAPRVHVSIGTYDAAAGESFPLDLTGGATLLGQGSGISVVDAGSASVALRLGVEEPGRAVVSGLTVRGAGVGIALGAAPEGAATGRSLALRDVALEGLETGVALDLGSAGAPLPISLRADGLRTLDTEFGLRAIGEGRLVLELVDCDLRDGTIGVTFESDPDEDVQEARRAEEEGVARVNHDVRFLRTSVSGMTRAGVLRVGRDGRNRGGPYRFEDCVFERNAVGVEFHRPCLDSQVYFKRTRFLSNEQFGVRLTGNLGPEDPTTGENLIEDCLFRWNGVGAHVTSSQIPFVVRRSRFLDNLGNGVFVSNFMTDPTVVRFESSLFANNGSHGIYSLADARLQSVSILACTVVDNDAGGIRDHRRHSGTSNFELRGCILAGNGDDHDLVDVDPALASYCWIGGVKGVESLSDEVLQAGNLTGTDPGFVDRAAGDYRLRPSSPCRDALPVGASNTLPEYGVFHGPFGTDGQPRDLGCMTAR